MQGGSAARMIHIRIGVDGAVCMKPVLIERNLGGESAQGNQLLQFCNDTFFAFVGKKRRRDCGGIGFVRFGRYIALVQRYVGTHVPVLADQFNLFRHGQRLALGGNGGRGHGISMHNPYQSGVLYAAQQNGHENRNEKKNNCKSKRQCFFKRFHGRLLLSKRCVRRCPAPVR